MRKDMIKNVINLSLSLLRLKVYEQGKWQSFSSNKNLISRACHHYILGMMDSVACILRIFSVDAPPKSQNARELQNNSDWPLSSVGVAQLTFGMNPGAQLENAGA